MNAGWGYDSVQTVAEALKVRLELFCVCISLFVFNGQGCLSAVPPCNPRNGVEFMFYLRNVSFVGVTGAVYFPQSGNARNNRQGQQVRLCDRESLAF